MAEKTEPTYPVYSPVEKATVTVEYVRSMHEGVDKAIGLPIERIDQYFAPVRPGQIAGIIGQASHYKSGLLHFIERGLAEKMAVEGREGQAIFHIATEEDVEEQGIIELAHYAGEDPRKIAMGDVLDWDMLLQSAYRIGSVPIYSIGMSLARPGHSKDLYISNISKLVRWACEEWKIEPAALFFDYLQAFPIDPNNRTAPHEQQRRLQVRDDVYTLKDMAFDFRCPVWVAIQAKQHLDGAISPTFQMPGVYDGEETAAIAQRFDRLLTIWMPKQTWPIGKEIKINENISFNVEEDMLFIRVAKQRGHLPSGKMWLTRIDFPRNDIITVEMP